METHILEAVVEPDGDRWHAYCPALHAQGAATWGHSRDEALRNMEEVVQLVIESMHANHEPLPAGIPGGEPANIELRVAVNV